MLRNKNTDQYKQFKLSAIVFAVVLIVGTGVAGVKHFINQTDEKLATALEQVPPGDIPAWWFREYFGSSVCETEFCKYDADPDQDKLSNYQEYFYGTNPNLRDTNNNGSTDGEDVAFGYAPNKPGKVSFEAAESDENIVGESLVYNSEIKELIVDVTDFGKVLLPAVQDSELTVIRSTGKDQFTEYMLALDRVSKKYHKSDNQFAYLGEAIKSQNRTVLDQMVLMSVKVAEDFRQVPVPEDALDLHKYMIASWRNLPNVVKNPGDSEIEANKWYDSVQVMISLNQKIDIETEKLRTKYK